MDRFLKLIQENKIRSFSMSEIFWITNTPPPPPKKKKKSIYHHERFVARGNYEKHS